MAALSHGSWSLPRRGGTLPGRLSLGVEWSP